MELACCSKACTCCRKIALPAWLAGADPDRPKRPLPARLAAEAALEAAMVDLADAARAGAAGVRRELQRAGFHVSEVGGGDVPGDSAPSTCLSLCEYDHV